MIAKDSVRYLVEHRLIPRSIYTNGLALSFSLMTAPGDTMAQFFQDAALIAAGATSVMPDDFSESCQAFEQEDDRLLIVRIGMPEPQEAPQCRAVYVCFSRNEGKRLYFTSELDENGKYMLCAWCQDEMHLNFGVAPEGVQDETERIAALFWKVNVSECRNIYEGLRAG